MTIRTIVDGREEAISEYICDWPDCPNPATEVVAIIRELRLRTAVCIGHAALISQRRQKEPR